MSYKVAEKDIIRQNDAGQNVVVVPAGQPIPEGFNSATTGLRASEASTTAPSDGMTNPPVLDRALGEGNGTEIIEADEPVDVESVEQVDEVVPEPVTPVEDATPTDESEPVDVEPKPKASRSKKAS